MQVLSLLPVVAFAGMFAALWARSAAPGTQRLGDWRSAYLRSTILWGAFVLLTGETLGLVHGLERGWVAVVWGVILVLLGWEIWRSNSLRTIGTHIHSVSLKWPRSDMLLLAGTAILSTLLFVVAWLSPPNNVDSLLYHMARVVHWAQNHSLEHYPAVGWHQLLKPIWAELAILHLRVLWGSDRVAALVQWFSMVGSLVTASWIAGLMGARRRGQLLAALFALSIPMGILQSTSTQNDYVVAFWAVCLLALVIEGKHGPQSWFDKGLIALVTGLGTLTKGTFFVYVFPLLAWHFVPKLWREKPRSWFLEAALVLVVVVGCNSGFWYRNIQTFGGPYGSSGWLRENLTLLRVVMPPLSTPPPAAAPIHPVAPAAESTGIPLPQALAPVVEEPAFQGEAAQGGGTGRQSLILALGDRVGGGVARMVANNAVTPFGALNAAILAALQRFPRTFGQGFLAEWQTIAWNHEDTAGNPLHLLLILATLVLMLLSSRARRDRSLLSGAGIILATYAMIPIVIGHGPSIWGLRYQLPFFVLWAPFFGVAFGEVLAGWMSCGVGLGLLLASLPWVLLNNTRPVIGHPPWPTRVESVFVADPSELAFAILAGSSDPGKREAILAAADLVRARECTQVGLVINRPGLEYLYFWALEAPQSGIRVETLNPLPETERYQDPTFLPCAVVCTLCEDLTEYGRLPMITDFGGVRVFGTSDG